MRALAARTWTSLVRWARSLDYSLIALVVGFALVAPVDRPFASLLSLLQGWRPSLFASYDAALREAAIKRPNYMVQLATIHPTPLRSTSPLLVRLRNQNKKVGHMTCGSHCRRS